MHQFGNEYEIILRFSPDLPPMFGSQAYSFSAAAGSVPADSAAVPADSAAAGTAGVSAAPAFSVEAVSAHPANKHTTSIAAIKMPILFHFSSSFGILVFSG